MDHNARATQCFCKILKFGDIGADVAAAKAIYKDLVADLDALLEPRGPDAQAVQEAHAVAYPIVAFADETAVGASPELSSYWRARTLQVKYFQEHAAGDNFFVRLERLSVSAAPLSVLTAYHTALALGFRGRFAAPDQEGAIAALLGELHAALDRRGAFSAKPLALGKAALAPGTGQGVWGLASGQKPNAPRWTAARAWRVLGALGAANAGLLAFSLWYLRHAATPALQLIASVLTS